MPRDYLFLSTLGWIRIFAHDYFCRIFREILCHSSQPHSDTECCTTVANAKCYVFIVCVHIRLSPRLNPVAIGLICVDLATSLMNGINTMKLEIHIHHETCLHFSNFIESRFYECYEWVNENSPSVWMTHIHSTVSPNALPTAAAVPPPTSTTVSSSAWACAQLRIS